MGHDPGDIYGLPAKRLRQERTKTGLSIEKLAEAAGIGSSFLGHIETNERKPSLATVGRLAKALGIPVGELFRDMPATRRDQDHAHIQQFAHLIRGKTAAQKTAILSTLRTLAKELK